MAELDGLGARQELVVKRVETLLRIVPVGVEERHGLILARRQDAGTHDVAESAHHEAVDLVEGEPVAHEALELGHDGARVMAIEVDELGVGPAAVMLGQIVGQLVVAEGHERLDALLVASLEHAAVEVEARLIGLGLVAVREDAAPVDGHAVALETHLAKELDVVEIVVIHIHGLVAGIVTTGQDAVGDVARCVHRAARDDIGHTEALAVLVITALALIGGGGAAPEESFRECHVWLLSTYG